MLPNHPNQLLQTALDKLSHELHDKMDNHLVKMQQEQQTLINDTLSQLIPTLLTKLTPIIGQEVKRQNQLMLNQVETCLSALTSTNSEQLKMLKLGREEYQHLQERMTTTLTKLNQLSLLDDDGVKFAERFAEVDNQLTDPSDQLTELTNVYDQRADGFIRTHRRARNLKGRYEQYAHEFKTATDELGGVVGAVSALVEAIIALFRKLFEGLTQKALGYAGEGLLYHANQDGSQGRKATTEEARDYVNRHPYDLSGYAQLKFTAKKLEKDKELRHEPSIGLGR